MHPGWLSLQWQHFTLLPFISLCYSPLLLITCAQKGAFYLINLFNLVCIVIPEQCSDMCFDNNEMDMIRIKGPSCRPQPSRGRRIAGIEFPGPESRWVDKSGMILGQQGRQHCSPWLAGCALRHLRDWCFEIWGTRMGRIKLLLSPELGLIPSLHAELWFLL